LARIGGGAPSVFAKGMRKSTVLMVVFCGLALVAIVLFGTHLYMSRSFGKPQNAGMYGDMFGVADAIFSGLALTAAFVTVWFQGEEVRATVSEIGRTQKDHREAVELQALASLVDAVDAAIKRGDQSKYLFQGSTYEPTELLPILLSRLLKDYDQIARVRIQRATDPET
jgi:uncharacterized membrane protein